MAEIQDVLRTEQKYVLNLPEQLYLASVLDSTLQRDVHNQGNGYVVRSLYFDTPDDSDFRDKIDGLEQRQKIRLRIYSTDAKTAKLELKQKQGSLQRKQSLTLTREQALRLCAGDYQVLTEAGSELAWQLYSRMEQFCYRPKCIVEYDRRAYTVQANDIRITLDSGLRASESSLDLFDPQLALYPVEALDSATMEVKFNGFLLSYVRDIISLASRTPCSRSKYCAARNITLRNDV